MSEAGYPAYYSADKIARRRMLCWLPLVTGAAVLSLCWIAIAVMLTVTGSTCFFGEPGLGAVGNALAHELGMWDDAGLGAALASLIYAALSLAPFLLLSGCVHLAGRNRTTLFPTVLSITGTTFVALYDILGFWAASVDIQRGSFLCSLAFELVPIGGVVAGACAVTFGSLAALVVEWRRRAHG